MDDATTSVVLASGSPRRRELLGLLGVPFRVLTADLPEISEHTDPARVAEDLAVQKARAVAERVDGAPLVLAADTLVALEGAILGKPRDAAENAAFIRRLAGRTHEVFTGVAALRAGQVTSGVERTEVTFRALTDAEVQHYAASGEGLDKAGGYGIQALGMALVACVNGDYSNVVGFPLALVTRTLRAHGVPVWGETSGALEGA
ncbi:Maf family nucleotide pyrophosphatase [Deinococcus maricopensis]|uniref:dTTP/UTP pyrophosphatase n=1 Tax=Deinococcus maricopensis (strain DSM 21211 / LMG 22137 / NRRL B-23946 / LB-34) TaxID=709986 RepID=E8UAC0_DEIML|nr:Maf family nucleotide pyrophosphatase [Deinococcus maricopensis]ADV68009.1 Septum formation protein Maf [Deinococcus maricopensis DSM 21211]